MMKIRDLIEEILKRTPITRVLYKDLDFLNMRNKELYKMNASTLANLEVLEKAYAQAIARERELQQRIDALSLAAEGNRESSDLT